MAILMLALLFPLAAILQSTLLWEGLPGGITPDVCLMLTLFCGFRWGAAGGSAAGLWAGVLMGAMRACASLPLAVLYGLVGWLAGLHRERRPEPWTYPVAGLALVALLAALEGHLAAVMGGTHPPLSWLLPMLAWHALFCLSFLAIRR